MKYTLLFFASILLFSCTKLAHKIDGFSHLTFNYTAPAIIPKTDTIYNSLDLAVNNITTDIDQRLADHNTSASDIQAIWIENITVYIDSPATQQFDPLTEVHVYISAPGLPEVEVANAVDITNDVEQAIELTVQDVDLKPYLLLQNFNTRVSIKTDEVVPQATLTHCDMKFTIDTKLLGQ